MRIGFALPQVGSAVGPETLVTAAQRAEDLGFDSLWVLDRILWPINPCDDSSYAGQGNAGPGITILSILKVV